MARKRAEKLPILGPCTICARPACVRLLTQSEAREIRYLACKECDQFFFRNLYDFQKTDIVVRALRVAEENRLPIPYAVNVTMGRYSLAEGKRRVRLKMRENGGASVDAFTIGKRLPGSFSSRQR